MINAVLLAKKVDQYKIKSIIDEKVLTAMADELVVRWNGIRNNIVKTLFAQGDLKQLLEELKSQWSSIYRCEYKLLKAMLQLEYPAAMH